MNGLIIILGESFREGNQGTRIKGNMNSYDEQIKACESHIDFIEHIIIKYKLNSVNVFISSYTTNIKFDNDLLDIYNKYLIGSKYYNNLIGFDNLFHDALNEIINVDIYDFILYLRIDLFLKDLKNIFNPTINTIQFPSITFIPHHKVGIHPRTNDMLLFIPKKYYNYLNYIELGHETWYYLVTTTDLTYNDLDVMINTFHDSDSAKDFNPLYYIVNRPQNTKFHSEGYIFNKNNFI